MIVRRGEPIQNFGAVKDFGHIGRLTVGTGLPQYLLWLHAWFAAFNQQVTRTFPPFCAFGRSRLPRSPNESSLDAA